MWLSIRKAVYNFALGTSGIVYIRHIIMCIVREGGSVIGKKNILDSYIIYGGTHTAHTEQTSGFSSSLYRFGHDPCCLKEGEKKKRISNGIFSVFILRRLWIFLLPTRLSASVHVAFMWFTRPRVVRKNAHETKLNIYICIYQKKTQTYIYYMYYYYIILKRIEKMSKTWS